MRLYTVVFFVLLSIISCKRKKTSNIDVSNVDVNFTLNRYEVDFYNSTKKNLPLVKDKYPFLFPETFPDSIALKKISNKEEQELFIESQKEFKDVSILKEQIESLFKHVKFYNPKFKPPNVVTMLTNIDYDNRIIYADSLMLVSLDVYLGKDHPFYADYPKYIKENNTKDNIIVDVANSIINKQFASLTSRTFINKIINEGKKMYVLDMYLQTVSDKLKIGYTDEKLKWAEENEENVWKYFIEKKILFSTETKLNKRFIDVAPFSKFYLSEDHKSPGRVGVWIGWQIVRSFMKHNDVSLQELINIKPEDLFKKSKYKPKK